MHQQSDSTILLFSSDDNQTVLELGIGLSVGFIEINDVVDNPKSSYIP